MFKKMRRHDKEVSKDIAIKILEETEYGVLSTIGEDGYPYGVPIHHVCVDGKIYFHCAMTGHKLDNIKYKDKVSFCVVGQTEVIPNDFSTDYESVVVFGRISEVFDDLKQKALLSIIEKYSKDFISEGLDYIAKDNKVTKVMCIDIEHITGKVRRQGE